LFRNINIEIPLYCQLLLEIEHLKKKNQKLRKPDLVVVSRGSSPIGSDGEDSILQNRGLVKRAEQRVLPRHRTYTIRRRLQQIKPPVPTREPRLELKQDKVEDLKEGSELPPSSSTSTPLPRKTRSSSRPDDLVPSGDLTMKRKRRRKHQQMGESEAATEETPVTKSKSVAIANGSELKKPLPKSHPRIRIHLEENYISTPDPEFLPSTLFKEVGEQEIPEVLPGNIEAS